MCPKPPTLQLYYRLLQSSIVLTRISRTQCRYDNFIGLIQSITKQITCVQTLMEPFQSTILRMMELYQLDFQEDLQMIIVLKANVEHSTRLKIEAIR